MKSLIIIFVFIFPVMVHSQEIGRTVLGVKGGLNISNIGGEESDLMKTGGHIGIYIESQILTPLKLQIEFMVSEQGHNPKTDLDDKLKLIYFNIPLLAKFYPAKKINIQGGPQFGFLLNAKAKYENLIIKENNNFEKLDLGLLIGAGYEFKLLNRDMDFTLRYIHGMTNIYKDPLSRYNRVLQASIGIMIFEVKNSKS